jgi:hypothetical protein
MTYRSAREALHVLLAVPFALTGGIFLLKFLGYNFSVAVWVGFIALFGTAVQTGVVIVIYFEEAVRRKAAGAGGLTDDRVSCIFALNFSSVFIGACLATVPAPYCGIHTASAIRFAVSASGTTPASGSSRAASISSGTMVIRANCDMLLPITLCRVTRTLDSWQRLQYVLESKTNIGDA